MDTPPKVIDPTKNVIELVNASIKRLDDLAEMRERHFHEEILNKDIQYQFQFTAAEKAVAAALDGTREAINKADVNTDKRFDLLSEKIDGITTTINKSTGERGIYVTHNDLSAEMEKLRLSFEGMLRPVVTFMNSQTGQSKGLESGWVHLIQLAGFIAVLLSIYYKS